MVIDAFSKYAWVEPIKSKTGKAVTEAFEKILKRAKGGKPINAQTDHGKEFYYTTFAALMKQKNIHHFQSQYCGTFQSYFQGKVVSICYGQKHARLFNGVVRFGQRIQCVMISW